MRVQANLNGTPNSDNIVYYTGDPAQDGKITNPTQVDPSLFNQPHCRGASLDVTP